MTKNYRILRQLLVLTVTLFSAYLIGSEETISYTGAPTTFRPILPELTPTQTSSQITIVKRSDIRAAIANPNTAKKSLYPDTTTVIIIDDTRQGLNVEDYQLLFTLFGNLGEILYIPEASFNRFLRKSGPHIEFLANLIREQAENY